MSQTTKPDLGYDPTTVHELLLVRLRYKEGRLIDCNSHKPISLNRPDTMWVVYSGKVDLFSVPLQEGRAVGSRVHIAHLEAGQFLFGLPLLKIEETFELLAVGTIETKLIRLELKRLITLSQEEAFRPFIEHGIQVWIKQICKGLMPAVVTSLRQASLVIKLIDNQELTLMKNMAAAPKHGLIWVRILTGTVQLLGEPILTLSPSEPFFPLAEPFWIHSADSSWLETVTLSLTDSPDALWDGLAFFHHSVVADLMRRKTERLDWIERERLDHKHLSQQQKVEQALTRLSAILHPQPSGLPLSIEATTNPLLAAFQRIGQALHLTLPALPISATTSLSPEQMASALRLRLRRVALRDQWWRTDVGPLLGFVQPERLPALMIGEPLSATVDSAAVEEKQKATPPLAPVVIMPMKSGYEIIDPITATHIPVTAENAEALDVFAYTVYRSFPPQAITPFALLRFGLQGLRADLWAVALAALIGGLLSLALPIAIGILFESVIPGAETGQLLQLSLILVVITIAAALIQLTRSFAFMRLQLKLDNTLQAAVWDRLLQLPATFFRQYTIGDLVVRASGISTIRQALTGPIVTALFGGVFSLFYLGLLFYYSPSLAMVALGLVGTAVGITTLMGGLTLRYQRQISQLNGQLWGLALEYINGITKFRVSGTESWAFARWATVFTEQRQLAFRAETITNGLTVLNASYPLFANMVIFALFMSQGGLSTGAFLAFYTAFTLLLMTVLELTATMMRLLRLIPIYERLQPILQTSPELHFGKHPPGELDGEIEISNILFRYRKDRPPLFNGLSLQIKPRQFVALVGPSGSGKSTLFRLLLGFEQAEAGSIYYDKQALETLDIQAIRRQIGSVLQHGSLMPGDIYSNIVGSHPLSVDDAWRAARMVGLAEDIEQMPMGMHTVISEGGGTFSGGQKQRLMIARAIVGQPRILLFDEATSALDNRTQAIVSKSLEELQATRIVIAHRLSTVINADCIFVIDQGRVVQRGSYHELMAQSGPFAELAKRQLV